MSQTVTRADSVEEQDPHNSKEEKKAKSRRPANTAFRQQRLKAWQPILTPKTVLPLFFAVGVIFAPIGGLLIWASSQVQEIVIDYTSCARDAPVGESNAGGIPPGNVRASFRSKQPTQLQWYRTENQEARLPSGVTKKDSTMCSLVFDIPNDIGPPVYLYYRLSKFYQNHRRYVKSLDLDQLKGKALPNNTIKGGSCDPLKLNSDGKAYYPCGLIANSLFNDSFSSPLKIGSGRDETFQMTNQGISWASDRELYRPTEYKPDQVAPPPNWKEMYPNGYTAENPPPNLQNWEEFQVWMRTAGLPTFSKLAKRVDNRTMTAGVYRIDIMDFFPVSKYDGKKSIVLTTTTVMGGKNSFLGIAYVVVGGICIILGALFTVAHLIKPRYEENWATTGISRGTMSNHQQRLRPNVSFNLAVREYRSGLIYIPRTDLGFPLSMPSTALAAALILAALSTHPASVLAQDVDGWYKANPGLSRVSLVNQNTNQIVDEFGRTRFFHGTNAVKKGPPYYLPSKWQPGVVSFGERDVQNMRDLGMNIVRLGHNWAGAEPVRGQYNETFFDIMKKQTKLAEDHGIYVLVDVHQDLLARQFCGNGVPEWFVKSDWVKKWQMYPWPLKLKPFPVDSNGFPSPPSICETIEWSVTYFSTAVADAFDRFYRNHDGLADAFAAYWKKLASVYDKTTNIVGYNLLNEPWVGNTWRNPTLLIPGLADRKVFQPLWDRVSTQIRSVDNDTLIWFEGATFDILSGFEKVPLGDGSKAVHSFHYYRPPQLGTIADTLYNRRKDNRRLKTAGVLTELWFKTGDAKTMRAMEDAMSATDEKMFSWIGWTYDHLYNGTTGEPYPELARHYSRPYPAAVAGNPKSYHFDPSSGTFKLVFIVDPKIKAPTELILPTLTYPQGFKVQVSPHTALREFPRDKRTLALFTAPSITTATEISVTITRN
ncbi:hypothetical protein LOZ58_002702 [Ophidiomyces ophidiicola]|nr:hypothetical protein LOZ58_002702 [Ophidiomyces ophidiicola]